MMNYVLFFLFPAAVNLGLGVYVWSRNPHMRENRLLALGCFCLSIYSFRIFEVYSRPVEEAEVIYPMLAFGPFFAGAFLSDFLLTLSKRPLLTWRRLELLVLYGPATFFSVAAPTTSWFYSGFQVADTGQYIPVAPDVSGSLPAVFVNLVAFLAIVQLTRTLLSTTDVILKKQLLYAVSGIGFTVLGALFIIIFLSFAAHSVPAMRIMMVYGAFCATIITATMAYAIGKYGLVPSVEELRRREEQLKREKAEALVREAELSRQVLDAQVREERLRHRQAQLEARHKQAELEAELQTAHEMQMGLMPRENPQIQGLDIAGRCIPANHVGGDYFQYFYRDHALVISVADVSGQAMEAAIPVVMFHGILESHMEQSGNLDARFQRLNKTLCRVLPNRIFICLAMGELELSTRTFCLSNGALPYPYYYQSKKRILRELQLEAYPLGVQENSEYGSLEIQLQSGDRIIFCSDGLPEATNASGMPFGYERLEDTLRRLCLENLPAEATINRIFETVDAFRDAKAHQDDMTCLVMRVEA